MGGMAPFIPVFGRTAINDAVRLEVRRGQAARVALTVRRHPVAHPTRASWREARRALAPRPNQKDRRGATSRVTSREKAAARPCRRDGDQAGFRNDVTGLAKT
jgi:hypothetical protein